jgi:hypothetical protein
LNGTQTGLKARVVIRSFIDLYNIRQELAGAREPVPTIPDRLAAFPLKVAGGDAS